MDPYPALLVSLGFVLAGTAVSGILTREPLRRVQMIGRPVAWPTIILGVLLLGMGYLSHIVAVDIVGWVALYVGLVFKSRPGRRWFRR